MKLIGFLVPEYCADYGNVRKINQLKNLPWTF